MTIHKPLEPNETDKVRTRLKSDFEDPSRWSLLEAVADHVEGEHNVNVISPRYSKILREHHAALAIGELGLRVESGGLVKGERGG